MFLKRIEMQGFKSFADRVVIEFTSNMIGIVGPNGCGKSNISDAIRWVLGEQSIKSLRGEKMTDVIFAGSEGRKPLNMAEVSLIFDNSERALNSDATEIEITRRIYNTDQEAEYLINKKQVRLKDVMDLLLDTGLGKDSLSMISQGNISSFAEAKPYERRAIFEEAAGVAKYKKKKTESLSRLERTKENLDRTQDILAELEKQIQPLQKAAKKAEIYREKKQKLEEIEIAYLVNSIQKMKQDEMALNKEIFQLETAIQMKETACNVLDNSTAENKSTLRQTDKEIASLQERLVLCLQQIQRLELRKVELTEKRKYILQHADEEERVQQLETQLLEAKMEWENRQQRFNQIKAELALLNQKSDNYIHEQLTANATLDECENNVRHLENRINILENLLRDPFANRAQSGIKTIMDNRASFPGILGVVGQEMLPKSGYEEAISAALAGSIYHIVSDNQEAARRAIDFLRKNRSGRATFLPLSVLQTRNVSLESRLVAQNTEGFLGVTEEFCTCDSKFSRVKSSLLGNILVCDSLLHANQLAERLHHTYSVVTLEGDIVHRGGTMTGGRIKNATSLVGAQNELEKAKGELLSRQAEVKLANKKVQTLRDERSRLDTTMTEHRITLAQLETVLEAKRAKYDKLRNELDSVAPERTEESADSLFEDLIQKLNEAYATKDSLTSRLGTLRVDRDKLNAEIDRKEMQERGLRKELDAKNLELRSLTSKQAVTKSKLDDCLLRLTSEYQMTFEYATENVALENELNDSELIESLRQDIRNLGNINMSAPEEYATLHERYALMKESYDELLASRDKLLAAIEEMDETMKKQFQQTFQEINKELPHIFTSLFGGGKAKLVLEDETDILNTGIDIDVQPPGKAVKSIRLFSGGEKTLIAICVLFTILKIRHVPLILFDEVEAALDEANVERLATYIQENAKNSQFILITHRPGTMERCDILYGVTMQHKGVSQMMKVKLVDALQIGSKEEKHGIS